MVELSFFVKLAGVSVSEHMLIGGPAAQKQYVGRRPGLKRRAVVMLDHRQSQVASGFMRRRRVQQHAVPNPRKRDLSVQADQIADRAAKPLKT